MIILFHRGEDANDDGRFEQMRRERWEVMMNSIMGLGCGMAQRAPQ